MNKAPQITEIVLLAIALLYSANQHGKTKQRTENFWHTVIACTITTGVLIWGHFFDNLFN